MKCQDIGKFNQRCACWLNTFADASTGLTDSWALEQSRWCRLEPIKTYVKMQRMKTDSQISHNLYFRGHKEFSIKNRKYIIGGKTYFPVDPREWTEKGMDEVTRIVVMEDIE